MEENMKLTTETELGQKMKIWSEQEMTKKIIEFLNAKGGSAKLSEIKTNFEKQTLESIQNLSVAPGSVVLDLIASNKLYLDSDWKVGVMSGRSNSIEP